VACSLNVAVTNAARVQPVRRPVAAHGPVVLWIASCCGSMAALGGRRAEGKEAGTMSPTVNGNCRAFISS
jgi:hypothetical protein